MTQQVQQAYVLHRRPFRETSLLLELFGRETGRFSAVAKGVRRAKSNLGQFEPFTLLDLRYAGRGGLKTITSSEILQPQLRLSLAAFYAASYFNELLIRLLPLEVEFAPLFDTYGQSLQKLKEGLSEPPLREFEYALLEGLGLLPDFTQESASGKAVEKSAQYYLGSISGVVPGVPDDQQQSEAHRGPVTGRVLWQVHEKRWDDPEVRRFAKASLRMYIDMQLGNRPLKSRQMMKEFMEVQRGRSGLT